MTLAVFIGLAVGMTLAAVAIAVVPLLRGRGTAAPVAALTCALAIPAAAVLLYVAASNFPWRAAAAVIGPPGTAAGTENPAILALRQQAEAATPGDAAPWAALADAYLAEERFTDAVAAYRRALAANGSDDGLRLALAEALILEDGSVVPEEASRLLDDVLIRDPANPKALWYGALAALAHGDTASARMRFSQLLALSPPPEVRSVIERQLSTLGDGPPVPARSAAIAVRVSISTALANRVPPGAVLFLIARTTDARGPPVAVIRRAAPVLPLDLELSDSDRMAAGPGLADHQSLQLTARLDSDGDASAAPGDVFGEATWQPAAGRIDLVIDQVTP